MNYKSVLDSALELGKNHHTGRSIALHAAFANSVAYLVTGMSGGYGGPSVREHLVSHYALAHYRPGKWDFPSACSFAEGIVYGELPLDDAHRIAMQEYCFDDDPEDSRKLGLY